MSSSECSKFRVCHCCSRMWADPQTFACTGLGSALVPRHFQAILVPTGPAANCPAPNCSVFLASFWVECESLSIETFPWDFGIFAMTTKIEHIQLKFCHCVFLRFDLRFEMSSLSLQLHAGSGDRECSEDADRFVPEQPGRCSGAAAGSEGDRSRCGEGGCVLRLVLVSNK